MAYDVEQIKSEYPQLAHLIDNPEIGPLLQQAHDEAWPADKFQARIMATQWWRTTADKQRQWDEKAANDPTTAARDVTRQAADMYALLTKMGGDPADLAQWGEIVTKSLRDGMSDTEIKQMLGATIRYREASTGLAGINFQANAAGVRQLAAEYLIPLNPSEVESMVQHLARGDLDENGIRARYREIAKAQRPSMAAALDAGVTVKQYMQPIVNTVAQYLEVAPDSIDLQKPEWQPLLNNGDPTGATIRPVSQYVAGVYARTRPEWAHTANAQEAANSMVTGIIRTMGKA